MLSYQTLLREGGRPLHIGETVREGDFMRIGESCALVTPCKYDKQGTICCVGVVVDEEYRWLRPT